MDSINRTGYIPLWGKAYVSRRGLILQDKKAEEIWEAGDFALKGKAKTKWLAYYMGMRSAVFDRWTEEQLYRNADAIVLHLGCGLDSRCIRVDAGEKPWYDVDFPEMIAARKRYFGETAYYHMISSDLREAEWLAEMPSDKTAIILMEGIGMYLHPAELQAVLKRLKDQFREVRILMDCYTLFGARASKYKNPIKHVGVNQVYGLEGPSDLEKSTGLICCREHTMTPDWLIEQLPKKEQWIFRKLFAGKMAKKIYRLYEFYYGGVL